MPRGVYQTSSHHPTRAGWGRRARPLVAAELAGSAYDDVFRAQLATFAHSRGVVRGDAPPFTIPRTTNADVRELVDYWTKAVDDVGVVVENLPTFMGKVTVTDKPGALGTKSAVEGWFGQALLAQRFLAAGQPGDVYPLNANLWHAMQTLATALAIWKAAPSKWDLAVAALEKSAGNLVSKALDVGKYVLIGAGVIAAAVLISRLGGSGGAR